MQRPPNYQTHARIAGVLFLAAIVAAIVGGGLIETYLGPENQLANAVANKAMLGWAVGLEALNALAVIAIGALFFPVLRQFSEASAAGYLGMRISEAVLYFLGAMIPLALINMGQSTPVPALETAAPLLALRPVLMELAVPIFLGLGGLVMYVSAFKSGILPRFLTLWGMVAAAMMVVGNIWDWSTYMQILLVMPLLLNEVVLGLWLIVRGFTIKPDVET